MKVFFNFNFYSILIPYEVFEKIGLPEYFQLLWNKDEKRILIKPATKKDEAAIDVPKVKCGSLMLALSASKKEEDPFSGLNKGKAAYSAEARLVRGSENYLVLIDLNSTKTVESNEICGPFIVPKRYNDPEDEDDDFLEDEEEDEE